jgi:CRISPR-associated protein Cmr3
MNGTWRGYRLVPEDVLFFRDGKPSSIGDDHYLRSIFPPYPSTLYGLVRTQRLFEEGCDLTVVSEAWWKSLSADLRGQIGEWNGHGSLRLRGPWLVQESQSSSDASQDTAYDILLPAPDDLRIFTVPAEAPIGSRKVTKVVRLLPEAARDGRSWSHNLAAMVPWTCDNGEWHPDTDENHDGNDPEPAHGWFLTMRGVESWMAGLVPSAEDFVDSSTLWSVETRTGVGLQKTQRMSMDRMLYTFGFIRLNRGISLGFELTGGSLQPDRHVRLGGENRLALLQDGPSLTSKLESLGDGPKDDGVFALITPGIYGNPDLSDNGSVPDAQVSAAVVSETVRVGGWDLAHHGPKKLWRAVPAGSVFYIDGPPIEQLHSLSKQANEGFGLMLRGNRPRR